MSIWDDAKEKWTGSVNRVVIGAGKDQGGTRTSVLTVGGGAALPFMNFEGETPCRPVVAMEVWDREPEEWAKPLSDTLGDVWKSPDQWAKKCVTEFGADLVCLKLAGTHPDFGDAWHFAPLRNAGNGTRFEMPDRAH